MKKSILINTLFIIPLFAVSTSVIAQSAKLKKPPPKANVQKAAPKKAVLQQFASIAVDRSQNFAYGVSWDQPTKAAADKVALEEVAKRGGKGAVVLSWSGNGCGAYRTIEAKSGTAYGWGTAATQDAADAIAMAEATKRANGALANNHAWACNSNQNLPFEEIFNDPNIYQIPSIKIGEQTWATQNLDIGYFRNGDKIPFFTDYSSFFAEGAAGRPAAYCGSLKSCAAHGPNYNAYAMNDPRGLAPEGWRVPSLIDFRQLENSVSNPDVNLRANTGWGSDAVTLTNPSGFNAVPSDACMTPESAAIYDFDKPYNAFLWTSTKDEYDQSVNRTYIITENRGISYGSYPPKCGLAIRLVK